MKALADSSRLTLVQALQEPQCVEELARRCNLAPSTVCFHLAKLEKAGLVAKKKEQYYAVYSLNAGIFGQTLRHLTTFSNPEQYLQEERVERYRGKVLKAFVKNGRVERLPSQYKKRLIIVREILKQFDSHRVYTESEVDTIIEETCPDYCAIRRIFVDEGIMERKGNIYRVLQPPAAIPAPHTNALMKVKKDSGMKSLKEIKREYKERKKPSGVFQIKNTANGKVLLGSSLNLEGPLNSHKFMLAMGSHRNAELQKEWNQYGSDHFVFEILEVVKVKDDPNFNLNDELELLEQIWIEKLQPFGEQGYNTDSRIRQV